MVRDQHTVSRRGLSKRPPRVRWLWLGSALVAPALRKRPSRTSSSSWRTTSAMPT